MKPRFLCLLVAISLAITPSVFAKKPQRGMSVVFDSSTWGRYHALIIGINDYKEWPRLRTAVKDASVIRDTLVSRYGFNKKNVILRTDKKASRLQIIRDLRYLAKSMRKDDNLFIYYAGHGQLDDFTGDGYWVPAEGKLKDPGTWVANSYIKAVLSSEKLQAKNVVVIADSCYSGSMLRGGPSLMSLDDRRYREKLAEKASLRSRQVISSGGVEPVADGGADGHSLFAYYLIDALLKNNREVIDLENLFHTKVWRPVTEIGNQRPNVGRLKTPMDQDGQFVLYNVALAQAQSKAKLRQPVTRKDGIAIIAGTSARTSPQNLNAEEELWEIVKTSSAIEDFQMFLDEYPNSRFSTHARLKIQQLKRKQNAQVMTAAVPPAVFKPKPVKSVTDSAASIAGVVASEGNYVKYSTGIVFDKKTNLEWYVGSDEDTNWYEADKWVKDLDIGGGGWQLPTKSDLRSIYRPKTGKRNMPPLLRTTGWWVWSFHSGGRNNQTAFYFGGHSKYEWQDKSSATNMRAFAVRSRKNVAQVKSEHKKPDDLYASVAPALVNQNNANSRKATQNRYRVVLFPIKAKANTGAGKEIIEQQAIDGISSMIDANESFELAYTYKKLEDTSNSVELLTDILNKEKMKVWKKKSFITKSKPDWERVKNIGLKINAHIAILVVAESQGATRAATVYFYDFERDKSYSKSDRSLSYTKEIVRQIANKIIKEAYNND